MTEPGKRGLAPRTAGAAPDPWARARAATVARIGLATAGQTTALAHVLEFQLAHARARDAVHARLDVSALEQALAPRPCIAVPSQAQSREIFLRRPDLGRLPAPCALPQGPYDAAFVLADGLSATALQHGAPALLHACLERLADWTIAPIIIATQARVALGDAIGAALGALLVAVIIGERPGLSVADSLGIYLTYAPRSGLRDSARNCISNIHPHGGLSAAAAADRLGWLMHAARARGLTGVALKEDAPAPAPRLGEPTDAP